MPEPMTEGEREEAEIEAWMTVYRLALSQAKQAARQLQARGVKLSPPEIVKKSTTVLTRTEIIVTI